MKILGIDPSVNRLGYGAVSEKESRLSVMFSGIISPPQKQTFEGKLVHIREEIDRLLEEVRPDIVAIEEIYLAKNVQIALKIGQVIGIVIASAMSRDISFELISTREVKKNVTGKGGADKEQVRYMVEMLTGNKNFKYLDESDAVAVAISSLDRKKQNDMLHMR